MMIGAKYYQKKQRLYLFLALYGVLALIGTAVIGSAISRNEDPSGAAGFMVIFGAGMAIMTWMKGRKPLAALHEDRLELNQTNRPEYVAYKEIMSVEKEPSGNLVLKVRAGHTPRKVVLYTKYLEQKDAQQLAAFLLKRGWKR